jgi:hypothetical protein
MKTELSKIAQDLEQGTITDKEARTLLLGLLGLSGSLTMRVEQMEFIPEEPFLSDVISLTDECMSSGTYTELLNYATNFNVPLLIHIVVCSTGK